MYPTFKQDFLGKKVLTVQGITNPYGVQCETLGWAYANMLWPGVSIKDTIHIENANKTFVGASSTYFNKIANEVDNPNQVPVQGDIMVFGLTPARGYTNTFVNPDGHLGICQSASSSGYALLQQNAPTTGAAVNVTNYPWNFRPCIGWLRPIEAKPAPGPSPAQSGQTVHLPGYIATWAVYRVGSLLRKGTSDQVGTILPSYFGGLTYPITSWVGNYAVNIQTESFGQVTIWVRDTPAVIS